MFTHLEQIQSPWWFTPPLKSAQPGSKSITTSRHTSCSNEKRIDLHAHSPRANTISMVIHHTSRVYNPAANPSAYPDTLATVMKRGYVCMFTHLEQIQSPWWFSTPLQSTQLGSKSIRTSRHTCYSNEKRIDLHVHSPRTNTISMVVLHTSAKHTTWQQIHQDIETHLLL